MKFRIAFIPSTATPQGEALDDAISEILLGFEWRQDDTGEAIQLEDGVWVEIFREKESGWFLVLNPDIRFEATGKAQLQEVVDVLAHRDDAG